MNGTVILVKNPMAGKVMGPRLEPALVILVNGHVTSLCFSDVSVFSKFPLFLFIMRENDDKKILEVNSEC